MTTTATSATRMSATNYDSGGHKLW